MACDLTNGRLLDDCLVGRAGIKTVFYAKYNDFIALTGKIQLGGEYTDLGADPITVYRFEMADNVGMFDETVNTARENGTSFLAKTITMTLFNIKPADLVDLDALKLGRWTMWTLDFQGKIRIFGDTNGCTSTGGVENSGTAAGDKKGLDQVFLAEEDYYALFMADYTTTPFDNFANVTVNPVY